MREHAAGATGDVPETMSAMVKSVWAAAWKRAAEQAATDQDEAVAARDRATDAAEGLRSELE